jgi:GrpB-like predicted nucleotidyltransferase (UPF0157 family)
MVQVVHAPYSDEWPAQFERMRGAIVDALGERAVRIEHVGSTSVPGLAAKPIIDICLEVPDTRDEDAYLPALTAAGFAFRFREPEWFGHRLMGHPSGDPAVNLHIFSTGCVETVRMVAFRDHLRTNAADRELYQRTKFELAERGWGTVQDYADAKTDVVRDIMRRALATTPELLRPEDV